MRTLQEQTCVRFVLDSEHLFGHHPEAMARTRVRWTRLWSLVAVAVVLLTLLVGRAGAGSGVEQPVFRRVYVVRAGDTLWGIASRIVGPAGDPRPVVDRLARMNSVRDGLIRPGEKLRLTP